eukprot:m.26037 g.26037  ORF g.26037 m.26037 type:complete len:109 (+) comp29079_c0_seq2:21-347(+)
MELKLQTKTESNTSFIKSREESETKVFQSSLLTFVAACGSLRTACRSSPNTLSGSTNSSSFGSSPSFAITMRSLSQCLVLRYLSTHFHQNESRPICVNDVFSLTGHCS